MDSKRVKVETERKSSHRYDSQPLLVPLCLIHAGAKNKTEMIKLVTESKNRGAAFISEIKVPKSVWMYVETGRLLFLSFIAIKT